MAELQDALTAALEPIADPMFQCFKAHQEDACSWLRRAMVDDRLPSWHRPGSIIAIVGNFKLRRRPPRLLKTSGRELRKVRFFRILVYSAILTSWKHRLWLDTSSAGPHSMVRSKCDIRGRFYFSVPSYAFPMLGVQNLARRTPYGSYFSRSCLQE